MKAIMISIRPEWIAKILKGEKTIELRKTYPKCELPCKVYIYETKDKILIGEHFERSKSKENLYFGGKAKYITKKDYYFGKGKVVAEFTLNAVDEFKVFENGTVQYWNYHDLEKSCLTYDEISNYVGRNKIGYAWHIEDLKIYDKPKKLEDYEHFKRYDWWDYGYHTNKPQYELESLKRPPQSWCYVEEISNENRN